MKNGKALFKSNGGKWFGMRNCKKRYEGVENEENLKN